MKNILLLIVTFLIFFGCTGDDTTQKKLQPEDTPLIDQIADLYFIDIWLSRLREQDRDSMRVELNKQFEELHGIMPKEMTKTLKALEDEPKRYGLIMDSVIVVLKNHQSNNQDKGKK